MSCPKRKISFNKIQLGDIVDIVDTLHSTAPTTSHPTKYKMIRTSDVRNGFLNTDTMRSVTKETYLAWSRRTKLEVGDIILTREAPMGEVAKITKEDIKYFLGQRTLRLKTINKDVLTQDFLFQLLKSDYIQRQLRVSEKTGSNVGNIRIPLLKEVTLPIPEITIQNSISSVLTLLDNKIELNNEVNKDLENLARLIYKFWFVGFNFPDENGDSYRENGGKMVYSKDVKQEIPEGWKVKKISEMYIENPKSKIPVKDSLEKGKGDFPFFTSGDKVRSANEKIVSGSNLFLSTGGNFTVQYMIGDASYSTDTYSISSQYTEYIYYFLLDRQIYINEYLFTGSGLKHLQKREFKNLKILLPSEELMTKFKNETQTIFSKIQKNKQENIELERLRNLLLPMLINGQISIKD